MFQICTRNMYCFHGRVRTVEETGGSKSGWRYKKICPYLPSVFPKIVGFMQVIESRDMSHDDPAGPATLQSCDDAVRVSVLVSACSN